MNKLKPKKLEKGDTIAIIALSGVVKSKECIECAKKRFEDDGYNVVLSKNIFSKNRYLAGSDEEKVQELHKFFADDSIKAILCARGGYGAIRLLDKIDFDLIKNNPKIFAGYSDVTALNSMFLTRSDLISFYAPVVQSDFGLEDFSKFTVNSFFDTVSNSSDLEITPCNRRKKIYLNGSAEGILWGGNLATIVSLCGLDFIPKEKFIFFAEDLGEDVYKIDKMMTQLLNIPDFSKNLQGIVLGDFLDISSKKDFDDLFFEIGKKINKPIIKGFKITHAKEKITVPYGAKAKISTEDCVLKIEKYLK